MAANANNGGQVNVPPIEDVLGMIDQLHETVHTLKGRLQARSVKTRPPEPFDGTRSKLQSFLTQLELYMRVNRERLANEDDKVLFTTTYLTGPAFDWFEPIVCDFQENTPTRRNDVTQEIFGSFQQFKEHLQGTFGDIDATRNAERRFWKIRQTGSVARTASEFQQIIAHLDWDDDAYIARFEEILKPEIQEKLIWQERPDTLNELIARAVKIDNTLYDLNNRKKERQFGNTFRGNPRTSHY